MTACSSGCRRAACRGLGDRATLAHPSGAFANMGEFAFATGLPQTPPPPPANGLTPAHSLALLVAPSALPLPQSRLASAPHATMFCSAARRGSHRQARYLLVSGEPLASALGRSVVACKSQVYGILPGRLSPRSRWLLPARPRYPALLRSAPLRRIGSARLVSRSPGRVTPKKSRLGVRSPRGTSSAARAIRPCSQRSSSPERRCASSWGSSTRSASRPR